MEGLEGLRGLRLGPQPSRRLLLPACAARGLSTEPPAILPLDLQWTEMAPTIVQTAGEPALSSLGLAGWTPVGMAQQCLEYLHISQNLPWWATIIVGTVCIRMVIFPLVIMTQRHVGHFNNSMPQVVHLQQRFSEARKAGDQIEAQRYASEIATFMKEKNLNPFKNFLGPLAQAPFFISFFLALRGMANCPVDSMKDGGLYWFTDLTVPDQFYGLPVITSLTLLVTIELGVDTGKMNNENAKSIKYLFRAVPFLMLPFSAQFPAAILCYWASTNFFSVLQVSFLKVPAVREFFKIPKHIPAPQQQANPLNQKTFVENFRESWENVKLSKELDERKQAQRAIAARKMSAIQAKKFK